MALFVDSSEPKEIKDLYAWGVLSGVTTNPLIIAREAPDADLGERRSRNIHTGHVASRLEGNDHLAKTICRRIFANLPHGYAGLGWGHAHLC